MRVYWLLAFVAFVVLSGTAVVMGGLNQDEGWYLYAANLVAEGQLPYRDFFYTQGPLLPFAYSPFAGIWRTWGLLGARLFNLSVGVVGLALASVLSARLVARAFVAEAPAVRHRRAGLAALVTFFLLGTNLYHLYYLAIPKTYALASLLVCAGFLFVALANEGGRRPGVRLTFAGLAGLSLALASGARISLGAILPVVGLALLVSGLRRRGRTPALWLAFGVGGVAGLSLVYGPILLADDLRAGLLAAQRYHTARGGADFVWTVGSVSRLVRWYLPVFILFGLGVGFRRRGGLQVARIPLERTILLSFLAVFAVQMVAPFPYEDYQVPIMPLLAVASAVPFAIGADPRMGLLLTLGLSFATSFGSPLLERWKTNGQDRFWSLKKEKGELAQLQDAAQLIESMDPGGKTLFTQDLYLAVETNRKVPKGLEMGPFAMLADADWRRLLAHVHETCPVAALSGYTFAVDPPVCTERPVSVQLDYWRILEHRYRSVYKIEGFGQNATPLMILEAKR